MKNIPYLDGWRGIAIILVLIDHFGPSGLWYLGRLGVVLFFVLSGLFMGRLLFVKQVPLASFFAKRFSRIIPTLWIYVASMWIYSAYIQPEMYMPGFGEIAAIATFTSTYFMSIWEARWPVGQLWSLNVEEHGYAFLALGTVIVGATRGKISASKFLGFTLIAVCAVIGLYMSEVIVVSGSPWRIRSEVACLGLVASAAICVWRQSGRMGWMQNKMLPLAALALGLLSFLPGGAFQWNFSILVAPILLAFAVNYASSFPEVLKWLLSLSPLRWFGTCSFSIYLWQAPFFAARFFPGSHRSLCLLAALLAGAMSFYVIENPARIFLNRKWDQRVAAKTQGPNSRPEMA